MHTPMVFMESDLVNICYSRLFQNIYVSPLLSQPYFLPSSCTHSKNWRGCEKTKVSGWRPRVQNVQRRKHTTNNPPLEGSEGKSVRGHLIKATACLEWFFRDSLNPDQENQCRTGGNLKARTGRGTLYQCQIDVAPSLAVGSKGLKRPLHKNTNSMRPRHTQEHEQEEGRSTCEAGRQVISNW